MVPYNTPSLTLFKGCAQDFRLCPRQCAVKSGHAGEPFTSGSKIRKLRKAEYISRKQDVQEKKCAFKVRYRIIKGFIDSPHEVDLKIISRGKKVKKTADFHRFYRVYQC
jgi:hypothetical protein